MKWATGSMSLVMITLPSHLSVSFTLLPAHHEGAGSGGRHSHNHILPQNRPRNMDPSGHEHLNTLKLCARIADYALKLF